MRDEILILGGSRKFMDLEQQMLRTIRFHFLHIDQYSFGSSWHHREEKIPYHMLRYIVNGEADFTINQMKMTVKSGDIIYLPMGCDLECNGVKDRITFISIRFTTSLFHDENDFMEKYFQITRKIEGTEELKLHFKKMYEWAYEENWYRVFWIRGYLELILGQFIKESIVHENNLQEKRECIKQIKEREYHHKYDPRIQIAIDYMMMNVKKMYPISYVSEMTGMAETTFRKLFKAQVGKAPNTFIRELKLTTAAKELIKSSKTVNTIAYEVGFEDPNYFSRMFKKTFGMTPNQYRNVTRR